VRKEGGERGPDSPGKRGSERISRGVDFLSAKRHAEVSRSGKTTHAEFRKQRTDIAKKIVLKNFGD